MYALASLRCPLVSAAFAWQAWDNVHCQGVGCTPWRPSGVPWSPPLLRGRRGTTCTAKGSDVRPGVPPVSLGLRRFCVAGVGQRALPRGRMYALASLRCPLVSAAFAWQAWDNVHCQGVGCTPWRPSGVPWSPPLLRGRRGTMCTAKGSDVRPGVPPVSLGLRRFCVAGVGQRALPRGRMYALASLRCPLVSASFAWQAWDNVHCQGVGCTPWRPSGVPWSPPLLRGRRGTTCTAKGSDVRPGVSPVSLGLRRFCPGVSPVSLGLRRFCVAGVGQRALPRGRMYALASLRCPLVSAAFAWQVWDNVHCQGAPPLLRGRRGTHLLTHLISSHTHSLTHSLTHPLTHSLTRSLPRSLTHSLPHSLTPSLTHSHHSLTHSLTHSLAHPLTHFTSLHFTSLRFTSLHFTHFTHSHIPHSHTPHSHHSLTLSLTHCT